MTLEDTLTEVNLSKMLTLIALMDLKCPKLLTLIALMFLKGVVNFDSVNGSFCLNSVYALTFNVNILTLYN